MVEEVKIADIVDSSLKHLVEYNNIEAYEILSAVAKRGFFEEHQAPGSLNDISNQLIGTLRKVKE